MMGARDEARARIAARMARDTRRGAPVAPVPAQAPTGPSGRPVENSHLRLVLRRQVAATGGWRVAAVDCAQLAVAAQRSPL
jgi:hypothetical protein